jgi:pimeloyl-ACP methyl ester carboxylesterase
MTKANCNGIEIRYETFGDASAPPMLLIMGLGAQMIQWPEEFIEQIAARGFHVIRFDNRDVGESTWLSDAGRVEFGGAPVYTLDDMAADAIGLLDALGIERAHIVGASMGGMIAQLVALNHPERVLTLTSIMSHVGGEDAVPPTPEAMERLLTKRPETREEAIEVGLKTWRVIGSPGFPFDETAVRERVGLAFDRGFNPAGFMRQIAAVMAASSRKKRLGGLTVPACVIHGADDPLVPVDNAQRTADAIGDAELVTIGGMGHDLPKGAWPQIIEAIVRTAARASAPQT